MPPLPDTLDEETRDLIASIERLQKDIAELQIPRLQACKGPLSLQQNLAAELREDLDTFARKVEALDILVGDQQGEKNRRTLRSVVDKYRSVESNLRRDGRAALLSSKRVIDAQSKSAREELLRFTTVPEKQNTNEKVTDDALMKANNDVTEALRRTIALMQGELERSVLTSQMLDASSSTLRSTSSQHDTVNTLMLTSKQIITALEKSDWLDRLLILSAFAFFILVVLFVLKQRFIDRGIRIALWWTRFIPSFSSSGPEKQFQAEKVFTTTEVAAVTSTLTTSLAASVASSIILPGVTEAASEASDTEALSSDSSDRSISSVSRFDPEPSQRTPETPLHVEL